MRLAHKYGMDPGAEWEAVWVVSSLLNHYDSQSSVVLAKSYSACQTLELESSDPGPEEVDGVTGDKDLQGTEEACEGLHFPDLDFMTVSHQ